MDKTNKDKTDKDKDVGTSSSADDSDQRADSATIGDSDTYKNQIENRRNLESDEPNSDNKAVNFDDVELNDEDIPLGNENLRYDSADKYIHSKNIETSSHENNSSVFREGQNSVENVSQGGQGSVESVSKGGQGSVENIIREGPASVENVIRRGQGSIDSVFRGGQDLSENVKREGPASEESVSRGGQDSVDRFFRGGQDSIDSVFRGGQDLSENVKREGPASEESVSRGGQDSVDRFFRGGQYSRDSVFRGGQDLSENVKREGPASEESVSRGGQDSVDRFFRGGQYSRDSVFRGGQDLSENVKREGPASEESVSRGGQDSVDRFFRGGQYSRDSVFRGGQDLSENVKREGPASEESVSRGGQDSVDRFFRGGQYSRDSVFRGGQDLSKNVKREGPASEESVSRGGQGSVDRFFRGGQDSIDSVFRGGQDLSENVKREGPASEESVSRGGQGSVDRFFRGGQYSRDSVFRGGQDLSENVKREGPASEESVSRGGQDSVDRFFRGGQYSRDSVFRGGQDLSENVKREGPASEESVSRGGQDSVDSVFRGGQYSIDSVFRGGQDLSENVKREGPASEESVSRGGQDSVDRFFRGGQYSRDSVFRGGQDLSENVKREGPASEESVSRGGQDSVDRFFRGGQYSRDSVFRGGQDLSENVKREGPASEESVSRGGQDSVDRFFRGGQYSRDSVFRGGQDLSKNVKREGPASEESVSRGGQGSVDRFFRGGQDSIDSVFRGGQDLSENVKREGPASEESVSRGGQGSVDRFFRGGQYSIDSVFRGGQDLSENVKREGPASEESVSRGGQDSVDRFFRGGQYSRDSVFKGGQDLSENVKREGPASEESVSRGGQDSVDSVFRGGQYSIDSVFKGGQDLSENVKREGPASEESVSRGGQDSVDSVFRGGQDSIDSVFRGGQDSVDSVFKGGHDSVDSVFKEGQDSLAERAFKGRHSTEDMAIRGGHASKENIIREETALIENIMQEGQASVESVIRDGQVVGKCEIRNKPASMANVMSDRPASSENVIRDLPTSVQNVYKDVPSSKQNVFVVEPDVLEDKIGSGPGPVDNLSKDIPSPFKNVIRNEQASIESISDNFIRDETRSKENSFTGVFREEPASVENLTDNFVRTQSTYVKNGPDNVYREPNSLENTSASVTKDEPPSVKDRSEDFLKDKVPSEGLLPGIEFKNGPPSEMLSSDNMIRPEPAIERPIPSEIFTKSSSTSSDNTTKILSTKSYLKLSPKAYLKFMDIASADPYSNFKPTSSKDSVNDFPPQSHSSLSFDEPGTSHSYEQRSSFSIQHGNDLPSFDTSEQSHTPVNKKETFNRQDSTGQVPCLSPTDLLRKKQKSVTDQIIKSLKSQQSLENSPSRLHKGEYSIVSNDGLNNNPDSALADVSDDGTIDSQQNYRTSLNATGLASESMQNNPKHDEKDSPRTSSEAVKNYPGYGNSTNRTPSEMLNKSDFAEENKPHKLDPTSSQLLRKTRNREINEKVGPGYGNFTYKTPSEMLHMTENKEESSHESGQTPSQLFRKIRNREINDQVGPGYGHFSYTTPSELLHKVKCEQEKGSKPNISQILWKTQETNDEEKLDYENSSFTRRSEQISGVDVDFQKEKEKQTRNSKRPTDNDYVDDERIFKKRYPYDEKPGAWFFRSNSSDGKVSLDLSKEALKANLYNSRESSTTSNLYNSCLSQESAFSLPDEQEIRKEEIHYKEYCDSPVSDNLVVGEIDFSDTETAFKQLNEIQSNFLCKLNKKREIGESITDEDYQELTLIRRVIEAVIMKVAAVTGTISKTEQTVEHLERNPSVCLEKKMQIANNLKQNIAKLIVLLPDDENEQTKQGLVKTLSDIQHKIGTIKPTKNDLHSLTDVYPVLKSPKQKLKAKIPGNDLASRRSDFEQMGYLADVSNDYNGYTSSHYLTDGSHYELGSNIENSNMFGSRIAASPSISLNESLVDPSTDKDSYHVAPGGKQSLCDCNDCKRKWFYWNEKLEKDSYSTPDIDSSTSRIPQVGTRLTDSKESFFRSAISITPNPNFVVSSDEDNDSIVNRNSTQDHTLIERQETDSLALTNPSTAYDVSVGELSPRTINMMTSVTFPDDVVSMQVDLGPARLKATKDNMVFYDYPEEREEVEYGSTQGQQDIQVINIEMSRTDQEGSPDRSQKLYGSSQALDRRGDGGLTKRKQAGRSLTPDSKFMIDKEVLETQNRKLQTEVSTLQTENKLLKEKYNRSQARIDELENQLSLAQEDVTSLQESLNQEVSNLSSRTHQEINRGRDNLQSRIVTLTKENEALKAEVASLEKQLDSSNRTVDMVRHNTEKTRTLEAHKQEISALKEELGCVKALLEQSERHLQEEEVRHSEVSKQVVKLTELKHALQQQQDSDTSGTVGDKQLKSLEKRLKVTEERLHQERADRANNLSVVEDKLLTENARLQAAEKDLSRQLHREKEKNRNFDHRVKQLRDENEKLRLALPFDDARLLEDKKNYDIPYSSHSNQRAETVKHISDDMNYILSQIEKQDGLQSKDNSDEMIRTLWNKRELAYRQLQEYQLNFEELQLKENIMDGLKNLRDTYGQTESKLRCMEEQVEDARSQMITLEATYKEQLNLLVHERHDAFARLKTAEDILEAVRAENDILRHNTHMIQGGTPGKSSLHNGVSGSMESLQLELVNLESKVAQLTRANQRLEGELSTAKCQLEARNKTLQDVQSELDLTYNRLKGGDNDDRKQSKIDKLSTEISGLQLEMKLLTDKYNQTVDEKSKLESEVASLRTSSETQKARQHKLEMSESKAVLQLRDDITEKESRVMGLVKHLDDLENDLQKNRQELYIEQMHNSEMESEVESLRQTVDQRAQMFEALSGTEREQLAQYQILKDTLDSVNQELAQKHAQIIALDVNLSGQKDRTEELEAELEKLHKDKPGSDEHYTEEEHKSVQQLRTSELEKERSQLKQELVQAYSAIKAAEEQYRTLQTESAQLEQELVKEKTVILQITAEKGEIEQHLEELAEEHDSLIQEKNQCEEDLIKLETKLQEILQKYEAEARKQHADFQREYPDLPIEARKVVSELDSLKLLLDGKDREIGMLQDKINRQQIDIEFLHRKVELVHNDSISNREDVARMISELTLKMKEAVSMREVNQFLVAERTKLQNEKTHAERELEQERKHNDQRKKEISDVLRKVEGTETRQKTTEQDNIVKETIIVNLEADLHSTKNNFSSVEAEMIQLKNKLDNQNKDLQNITSVNTSLEEQIIVEKNMLKEERSALSKLKEEFNRVSHDFELLQHKHSVLSDKHMSDTQTIEQLRETLSARDEENSRLTEELHGTKIDLESQKGQLLITKDTVQKLSQDKGSIYQDYEGMCRTVTEKERQLMELKERTDERMNHLQKQHIQEKLHLEQNKETAVEECQMYKRELENAKEQLEQKEVQLNTFGKTLQELEAVTRQKNSLEAQLHQLEASTGDLKMLLEGQRKELMALNEALAKQQDRSTRIEAENHTLKADLKSLKDAANRETQELSLTIKELKSQHENERTYLNDNLAKTQTQLNKVETSLITASNERDTLQAQKRMTEKTVEELQAQLTDESRGRRLAEQSVGSLRLQLEDMRNEKNVSEARYVEMKKQLDRAEEQLKVEQTKSQKMSVKLQEVTALSHNTETSAKAKMEQIETLQKEISRLKQMIESQRQNMSGKMKKASFEFKQQLDLVQEDRDKLLIQVQKLSTDLEACREQLALKNKDNLKLQEDNLVLEDSVRESKAKQKQAEETLKVETEKLTSMANKFMEQDEELKRLRNFLAKKAEDSGEADKSMWQEMNRVIQDLSRQMQDHLDAQKSEGKDGSSHSQVVLRYKKQLAEIQGELSTEKSLHQITKTSLQALEEDCQRLRHQLHAMRRRDTTSTEKKYKNRTEAINALIARSQTQAQAILASGGYYDNMTSPRMPQSARAAYNSPQRPDSPDNSYSEDLSIASLPPLHYGSSSKQ